MAIISSGALTMTAIRTEFGGSNPTSLSEYYRNGAYTTSNNTGVPTSGAISMSQFYSTTAADYIPAAVAWSDFSSNTDDLSGYNYVESGTQTITGINQTITLLIDTSSWSCTASGPGPNASGTLTAYVNGSTANSVSILSISSGAAAGTFAASMTVSVVSGDVVKFSMDVTVGDFSGYANGGTVATWSVKNASSGNTVLDTFVASCGASTAGGA